MKARSEHFRLKLTSSNGLSRLLKMFSHSLKKKKRETYDYK